MYLIIYNDPKDNIVALMKKKMEHSNCTFLSVKELLNETEIEDEIKDGKPFLHWKWKNLQIENKQAVHLINRVIALNHNLFSDFHPDDQNYAYQEFSAYLMFALEAFPSKLGTPGAYGLAGDLYPLPHQWQLVEENLNIISPRFYIGPIEFFKNSSQKIKKPILAQGLYDYYRWRPENDVSAHLAKNEENKMIFIYERPSGEPYVSFVAHQNTSTWSVEEKNKKLSLNIKNELSRISLEISKILKLPLAEILFFVNGNHITFGMASNIMMSLHKYPKAHDMILNGIQDYFRKEES